MPDMNDLNIADAPLEGFSPDAELYQTPAPPDDGKYNAVLEQQPQYGTDLFWRDYPAKGENAPYRSTRLIGRISDPGGRYDNRMIFGDFVSTMIRNGSSTVAQIIKALGFGAELQGCQSHGDLSDLFDKAIATTQPVRVTTRWKIPFSTKVPREVLNQYNGQANFPWKDPENPEKGYNPSIVVTVTNPETGENEPLELEARAFIVAYYPIGEATGQPTGASAGRFVG